MNGERRSLVHHLLHLKIIVFVDGVPAVTARCAPSILSQAFLTGAPLPASLIELLRLGMRGQAARMEMLDLRQRRFGLCLAST